VENESESERFVRGHFPLSTFTFTVTSTVTMPFSLRPHITFLLLLSLAAILFAGGLRLARQRESVRLDRDRTSLRHFAGDLQVELERLEALYEDHLTALFRSYKTDRTFDVQRDADAIVGVMQVSFLTRGAANGAGDHVQIYGQHLPTPVLKMARSGLTGTPVLLPEDRIFGPGAPTHGWIDEPGKPLFFWNRRTSKQVVVFLIDRAALQAAVDHWLESSAADSFEQVRAGRGPDQLRGESGHPLLAEGRAPDLRADLVLPLRTWLGSWELVSWDRRETHVHYDTATLVASSVLALFVASLSVLIYSQQRRAAALAAQRVSFVNRVSHELRTPLTNILLNLDLATEALDDAPRDATRRLDLVQEEARRLGRLIDNVLTFSRQEQGKLRAEPRACVPASVIAATVEQFAPSFARRSLEVHCTGNVATPCLLDADALAQIVGNLLSNVEKYVPGGVVEIGSALENGSLILRVCDQGPGIPPEAVERIFRPFERLDSRVNEGASGTGLGLAIARDLAETMGGTLRLAPSEQGAVFELRVPAPPAPPLTSVSAA
jgi:signal transduction histidine kinase